MPNDTRPAAIRGHPSAPAIGPIGVAARYGVGALLIGLAFFWRDPSWRDPLIGFVVMPTIAVALSALHARRSPAPLRATGPLGHLLNAAVFIPLFVLPATAGAALLFYGASMLVTAARRAGGCEVTAISNMLLHRDDAVGCIVFAPVDIAEARLRHRPSRSALKPR
jgi:hypothetical protein